MSVSEIIAGGCGGIVILLALIQIAPIKINPWSAIAKAIGKAINSDVLRKLDDVEHNQKDTREALDKHIRADDERNADTHRARILQFNTELLREIRHTEEDFVEILTEIDAYEDYCRAHPEYPNNRAVLAAENIKRNYTERLEKHDFLNTWKEGET